MNCAVSINASLADGIIHYVLVLLDVGEECIERGVTVESPRRVGDDALQVESLLKGKSLRDQETTTGVSLAHHFCVASI